MVEGKWLPPGADIAPALALRREIFSLGPDEWDCLAWQALVLGEGKPVGAGRIRYADGAFSIGLIGVLPQFRGQGFGDFLTRLLLFKALNHSARLVTLLTPPETLPFFRRYGFTPSGEPQAQGLIPCVLEGQDILLDTCGGKA